MQNGLAALSASRFRELTLPVRFIGVMVMFCALSTLSYWNKPLTLSLVLIFSSLVVFYMPVIGWALLIFITPFQFLFAFDQTDFIKIRACLLIIVSLQYLLSSSYKPNHERVVGFERSVIPYLLLLFAYVALLVTHLSQDISNKNALLNIGFTLSLIGVFLASLAYAQHKDTERLSYYAIIASITLSILFSALFTYGGFSILLAQRELDMLRLAGVQDGPNSLGKLISVIVLALSYFFIRNQSISYALCLFIAAITLTATGSKSAILATCFVFILILPILVPHILKNWRYWTGILILLIGSLTWITILKPVVEPFAAKRWLAPQKSEHVQYIGELNQKVEAEKKQATMQKDKNETTLKVETVANEIVHDLRISHSIAMTKEGEKVHYENRPPSLLRTGQRDRTWKAGFQVVKDHWIWGIGALKWPEEMEKRLKYPFISPHNALLEVTGGLGILGGVLYLGLVVLLIRNFILFRNQCSIQMTDHCQIPTASQRLKHVLPKNGWILLFIISTLIIELVEPAIILGRSIHSVWFWILLALYLGQSQSFSLVQDKANDSREKNVPINYGLNEGGIA